MIRFTYALILVVCLCHRMALAQSDWQDSVPRDDPSAVSLFPISYSQIEGIQKDFGQPTQKTLSLELGPKLIELQALYLEKRQDGAATAAALTDPSNAKWGSYFNLLAISSGFGGKLIGEGELAYSTLEFAALPDQQPIMSRLGLRGSWGKANYGLQYRYFGSGFVSMGGIKVDRARDERQFWGEYDFGLFRLRGALGESWEKNSDTNNLTLTRTAATFLNLNKPTWSALLSSSYSSSGQDPSQQTLAFSNALSIAYRPTGFLTIEPGLSVKEEWDQATGLKTDTPSAGFALICSPYRDLQFTGRASYARGLSEDPLKEISTVNTAASLNWKIGKTVLGDQFLSFQVEYKNELQANSISNPQPNLTGLIQWKMVGF